MAKVLTHILQFFAVLLLFSLPIFFTQGTSYKTVAFKAPRSINRGLASIPNVSRRPGCKIKTGWRYKCDQDQKNCRKDIQYNYLNCPQ